MTLISELATGGELLEVLTSNKYITEIEVARIIQQILEGVEYMHSKSIGHLGLTPLDIMFSRPGGSEIKMADFSLARRIVGIVKMEYGQPEFVAPEIVNGEGASFASDLWAVGIITYLLLSGVSPFRGQVLYCTTFPSCVFSSFFQKTHFFLVRRMTVKPCNVSRWVILILTLSCGKILVVKLNISWPICWSTSLRRGWVLDRLWAILGCKSSSNLVLKLANNTKFLPRGFAPTMEHFSKPLWAFEFFPWPSNFQSFHNLYFLREWYANASCDYLFRRRPLAGAFTHPSCMVYPPGDEEPQPEPEPEPAPIPDATEWRRPSYTVESFENPSK